MTAQELAAELNPELALFGAGNLGDTEEITADLHRDNRDQWLAEGCS